MPAGGIGRILRQQRWMGVERPATEWLRGGGVAGSGGRNASFVAAVYDRRMLPRPNHQSKNATVIDRRYR